ncbi:hypothetical protein NDU88_006304 [Pleurodeles waltl]|uniref:Uncharacterized protein n=1 Tax=Pleurodeles waltl TaxID=8319 RepID=A0AAV7TX88_PLEWA|nr:hypothetical protein NDU88_006304 [Pleurodeles waltl]
MAVEVVSADERLVVLGVLVRFLVAVDVVHAGKYPRSLGVPWHRWVTGSVPVLKNPVPQLAPNVGRYQRYRSKPEVRGELRVKILEEGRHFIDPCMSTWSESLCCEVPRFPTATKDCCPGYRPDLDP